MAKFVYCLMCESGFLLEAEKIKTCKDSCRNVGGRYINPQDGVYIKAEVCAKNSDLARFVGIHKYKPTFDDFRETFLEINDNQTWNYWEKDHLAQNQKEWDSLLDTEGYTVGTVESLKNLQWHKNWKFNESLCSKFPL